MSGRIRKGIQMVVFNVHGLTSSSSIELSDLTRPKARGDRGSRYEKSYVTCSSHCVSIGNHSEGKSSKWPYLDFFIFFWTWWMSSTMDFFLCFLRQRPKQIPDILFTFSTAWRQVCFCCFYTENLLPINNNTRFTFLFSLRIITEINTNKYGHHCSHSELFPCQIQVHRKEQLQNIHLLTLENETITNPQSLLHFKGDNFRFASNEGLLK